MLSGLTMAPLKTPFNIHRWFALLLALSVPTELYGQSSKRSVSPRRTGYEVFLQGSVDALVGRPYRVRGTAYEVLGLADLRALPGADVRARYSSSTRSANRGPWVATQADSLGRFLVDVPIPAGAHGDSRLEVQVGEGGSRRTFSERLAKS